MDEIITILDENITAVFTLIGLLAGSVLSIIENRFIKEKDLKLRLKERILNRRIESHEKVIQLSQSIRAVMSLGRSDDLGELARYPALLVSKQAFYEWHLYFVEIISSSSTWLSINVVRELNLFQDYIVNLFELLSSVQDDECVREIGNIIQYDLVSFSDKIEKLSFNYIEHDLYKMSMGNLKEWHKYPKEETIKKLNSTALFEKREMINDVIFNSKRKPTGLPNPPKEWRDAVPGDQRPGE